MQPTIALINDAEWQSATPSPEDASFGSLETARGHLPLEAMDVRAEITGLSYRLRLKQTFVNNLRAPLEATYIFPLPPRAAVTEFRLRVADREVAGEIQERGKARAAYNQAIASGHRAAIAEEDRSGVFNMRVGNLLPGDRAEVEIVLTGPIELEGATATFRFPLVVAPRYIPGRALEGVNVGAGTSGDTDVVPDASRITPPMLIAGYPNPVRLSMRVELDAAGLHVANLRCALHAVLAEQRGSRQIIEVRPGERLNRDFILRFDVASDELTTTVYASPDADGEGGTFCLTAVPPRGAVAGSKPRDVVFVLDRSGSMSGWKMIAARRAVARMIDALGSADRFSVLAFDNTIETCPGFDTDLIDASDRNRYRAIEFLAKLEARGGTEMYQPLLEGAKMLGTGYRDRERVMVLVTDGQVGNEDQILRDLESSLGARLFTVGVDRAVNEGFLRRLAALGAGSCSLVESEDRLDDAMDTLHRRIGEPVITELSISGDGFEIDRDSLVPHRLPDLFASSPTVIYGRYRGTISGRLVLGGVDMAGAGYKRELEPREVASDAAASIWARGQIRQLEDDYAIGRRTGDLARRIVELSLRHKVLCRFTAFVAVDRAVIANPSGRNVEVVQPVESVEGWAADGAPRQARSRRAEKEVSIDSIDCFAAAEELADHDDGLAVGNAMPMKSELGRAQAMPDTSPLGGAAPGSPPPPAMQSSSAAMPSPQAMAAKPKPSSVPPSPKKKAVSKGHNLLRTLSRLVPSRRDGAASDSSSAIDIAASSLAARLEQIVLRHQARVWLEAAVRFARLMIEIDDLLADLRSLGSSAALIERVKRAREALASLELGRDGARIDSVLGDLIDDLRGGSAESPASRADEPFWR